MREYSASAVIDGPADRIWAVLTDVAAYPQWDPYCERIEGQAVPGGKLKVFSKLSPGRAFPVRVTEFVPHERMVWSGGMPFGLFKGVRSFTIAQRTPDSAEFTLREVFSGPMLKLIGGSIPDMGEPFEKFAAGLKARVEAGT